jgi:outer membrane receptor for ferrienterochelin and colicin
VQVALGAVASALPEVRVRERRDSLSQLYLADFWERRARGFGTFVTRDEIERLGATDFVQLLRHYPSVRVTSSRGQQDVRFNRGGDCPPQYWVDGMPLERASARDFTPYNVEAVELYPGSATIPGRFARGPGACGAIVIWTRLPG